LVAVLARGLHAVLEKVDSMMMSREDGLVEGGVPSASTRACGLALLTFAVGCSADPNVNDSVVDNMPAATTTYDTPATMTTYDTPAATTTPQPSGGTVRPASEASSQGCLITRTPITNPDGALLETLDRVADRYPIGGAWGTPAQLEFKPRQAPFEGELVVRRRDGDLVQLDGCQSGIEVPVAVALRTNDGALAESVEGIVLLTHPDERTIDGTPAPFRAELSAVLDLGALSGSFAFADDPTWTFRKATLRAQLTRFGTRGMLGANIERKESPEAGLAVMPPSLEPLLTWHGGDGCVGSPGSDPDPALYPAPTEARAVLDAALEMAAAETYRAKYVNGTETQVAVELAPLTLLCATDFWASYWHFPTRVEVRTDDGRLDVSIGVTIDPGFTRLHYNELTEVPSAYPPSRVEEQIGHIDVPMSDYAHVGIEAWFDLTPEPAGWIKVLGYDDSACARCDEIGGCIECAYLERVEILTLFIGTQADKP
jgi:hypothetical protein